MRPSRLVSSILIAVAAMGLVVADTTTAASGKRRGSELGEDEGYFWHFADTHFYPEYKEGTNPVIGVCRMQKGNAGKYGNYHCDTPAVLMNSAVEAIATKVKAAPDFVLYGGDHISIYDTTQSKEMAIERIKNLTQSLLEIQRAYPKTKIFSTLGNHDVVPQFQFPEKGPFYMYTLVAEQWGQFLSPESAKTLNHSAYYTELIAPGLRLVALNTVMLYIDDHVVPRTIADPAGQFAWFRTILANARKNGERIIVTTHVPPGLSEFGAHTPTLWNEFNKAFLNAFDGYNDLIVGSFYGHNHLESVRLIKDTMGGNGAHVAFLTSSVVPRSFVNPTITMYKYKKSYPFTILDRIPFYASKQTHYYIHIYIHMKTS